MEDLTCSVFSRSPSISLLLTTSWVRVSRTASWRRPELGPFHATYQPALLVRDCRQLLAQAFPVPAESGPIPALVDVDFLRIPPGGPIDRAFGVRRFQSAADRGVGRNGYETGSLTPHSLTH